jgi:hypothetical protein
LHEYGFLEGLKKNPDVSGFSVRRGRLITRD